MRRLTVTCDCCGRPQPEKPPTWWSLEQQDVPVLVTGPIDLCSLTCLLRWVLDPRVRLRPEYSQEFTDALRTARVLKVVEVPDADI